PTAFFTASTMSRAVTEPKRRPESPVLAWIATFVFSRSAAVFWASSNSRLALASAWDFSAANDLRLDWVAALARPRGMRKLRAYPSATSTSSPFFPSPLTSDNKMTFTSSPPLHFGVEPLDSTQVEPRIEHSRDEQE